MLCPSCEANVKESEFPKRFYKGRWLVNTPCRFCRKMDQLMRKGPTVSKCLERTYNGKPTELTEAGCRR